jgi:flagellar motor switch protein FliM
MTDRPVEPKWEKADFRRPSRLSRDQIRSLDVFHETFTRRLGAVFGSAIRTSTAIEVLRTTQVTWEDYVRTLPNYTMLVTVGVPPLPAAVLIEADTSVALALADRLLGGRGTMGPPRRPTELEVPSLRRLAGAATGALGEAFGQFVDVQAAMTSLDFSPQFVAVTAPTNMVLVLTYMLSVPVAGIAGDVTVVVPLATLAPALARLAAATQERDSVEGDPGEPMEPHVRQLPVTVEAQLNPTPVPAAMIASLSPGDVIVLDHRMNRPATAVINGTALFTGHLGRRGRRFALSVDWHPFDDGPAAIDGRQGAAGDHHPVRVHDGRPEETHDA